MGIVSAYDRSRVIKHALWGDAVQKAVSCVYARVLCLLAVATLV